MNRIYYIIIGGAMSAAMAACTPLTPTAPENQGGTADIRSTIVADVEGYGMSGSTSGTAYGYQSGGTSQSGGGDQSGSSYQSGSGTQPDSGYQSGTGTPSGSGNQSGGGYQ